MADSTKDSLTPAEADKLIGCTGTIRTPDKGQREGRWVVVGYATDPADDDRVKFLKLETCDRHTGVAQIVDGKRVGAPLMVLPEDVATRTIVVPERPDQVMPRCPARWFTADAKPVSKYATDDDGAKGKASQQVKQPLAESSAK